jgi:uncharacterized membrane protein YedE/YeeE
MSESVPSASQGPKPYWNPYVAGVGLGLTLLAAFVIMGRGLGASGGFTTAVSYGVQVVDTDHASANEVYAAHLESEGGHPLKDWLVFEVLGVFIGGLASGILARRVRPGIDRGPRISSGGRLAFALTGGFLMGFAAKLARGCTSGQALTGGALLSVGSWIFMLAIFAGGYAFAAVVRKQWT